MWAQSIPRREWEHTNDGSVDVSRIRARDPSPEEPPRGERRQIARSPPFRPHFGGRLKDVRPNGLNIVEITCQGVGEFQIEAGFAGR